MNSAVQLTFPCPSCGGFVTLRTFRGHGPCPVCQTKLSVELNVTAVVEHTPEEAPHSPKKCFNNRRFRPASAF